MGIFIPIQVDPHPVSDTAQVRVAGIVQDVKIEDRTG